MSTATRTGSAAGLHHHREPGAEARTATVTINGVTVTVTQVVQRRHAVRVPRGRRLFAE
jgi:hypothetical protein